MYRIELMTAEDIEEVAEVERACFTNPWPIAAYRRELKNPRQNYYIVLRQESSPDDDGGYPVRYQNGPSQRQGMFGFWPFSHRSTQREQAPIIGFAGMWHVLDEAHVTTIGVLPDYQGRGLGEVLFLAMVDEAIRRNAVWLTLEVRVSNYAAQQLYRKYGFSIQGKRQRYYTDNNEDAYIMWSESFRDEVYRKRIEVLRDQLRRRLSGNPAGSIS